MWYSFVVCEHKVMFVFVTLGASVYICLPACKGDDVCVCMYIHMCEWQAREYVCVFGYMCKLHVQGTSI